MTTTQRTSRPVSAAVCIAQADLLLLLADMLEPPAHWQRKGNVISDPDAEALAEASGLAQLQDGTDRLRSAAQLWRGVDTERANQERARLFDGGLACPCNETVYIRRDKGAILADIAGFYRAFGFALSGRFREKHDHIVAELQFAALLSIQFGYALDSGSQEHRDVTGKALRSFLDDHLGAWIGLFATRLEQVAAIPFYRGVAQAVRSAWDLLQTTHELEDPGDEVGPVLQDAGTPYECGLCADSSREEQA